LGIKPGELAGARPWKLAAFTTYALSLSFFESVVMDRLVRGRSSEALILADAEGIRAALSEQGAQRAGREYEIEPVCMPAGVFHPKISFFTDGTDTHLLVGSGNLTFGGWGRNLELVEHLHPSFASAAMADAADFFEQLATHPTASHGAQEQCGRIADTLLRAAAGSDGEGNFRILHGFGRSIGIGIAEIADTLGGATRLVAVSPYWDAGSGLTTLCKEMGLERVHVHAHPALALTGSRTDCWPRNAGIEVVPVSVDDLAGDLRPLHAKAFEVHCRKGSFIVSGSANGTRAALYGPNVEACVARIQTVPAASWLLSPAQALPPMPPAEEVVDADAPPQPAILRSRLSGDVIEGRVLSGSMKGPATLSRLTSEGLEHVCDAVLSEDGSFKAKVPGLEAAALGGGRFVLRVDCGGKAAEGFVSLVFETNLRKFAGKAAASIMDIIRGSEPHGTVIVLMEWAHENIEAFMHAGGGGGGNGGARPPRQPGALPDDLFDIAGAVAATDAGPRAGDPAWVRFLDTLMGALRQKRGPFRGDDESEDEPEAGEAKKAPKPTQDELSERAKGAIGQVVELLLQNGNATPPAVALRALDLAAFACNRLPGKVTSAEAGHWLKRSLGPLMAGGVPDERKEDVAAAAIALAGPFPGDDAGRHARTRLLRIGWPLDGTMPSPAFAQDFIERMEGECSPEGYAAAWNSILSVTTWREQARIYVSALAAGEPSDGYEELLARLPREAETMRKAIGSDQGRKKLLVVDTPTANCCRNLPRAEQNNLATYGVGRAANCCQKVLIWPETSDG
jgi:hypothetical protein